MYVKEFDMAVIDVGISPATVESSGGFAKPSDNGANSNDNEGTDKGDRDDSTHS